MSDLNSYTANRIKADSEFSDGFEEGYQAFKIGILFKEARLAIIRANSRRNSK
jgi:hypothetical protein